MVNAVFKPSMETPAEKAERLREDALAPAIRRKLAVPPAGKCKEARVQVSFFNGDSALYTAEEFKDNTQMAWATTVHKSQGCENRVIIMLASETELSPYSRSDFFTKELLYTAVTRARELLFIVGSSKALKIVAARPPSSTRRVSFLSDRLFHAARDAGLPLHPMRRFGRDGV